MLRTTEFRRFLVILAVFPIVGLCAGNGFGGDAASPAGVTAAAKSDKSKAAESAEKADYRFRARLDEVPLGLPPVVGRMGPSRVNAILAQINDEVITWEDVVGPMRGEMARWRAELSADEFLGRFRIEITRRLQERISRTLVLQEAEGMLSEGEKAGLESALENERKDMITAAGSKIKLEENLKARGTTIKAELAKRRKEILVQQFLRKKIGPKIHVTRQELLDYYQGVKAKRYVTTTRVTMRLIVLKKSEFPSRAAATGLAEAIEERAKAGEDFAKLARRYSHGLKRAEGGLWGEVGKGSYRVKAVDEALFALPHRGVSKPIETDDAFYIVQAADRREGRVVPFTEVQRELEAELRDKKFNTFVAAHILKLRSKAYVNIMAGDL